MKSRHVLIIVSMALFTLFGLGRHPAQAAELSASYSDKVSAVNYLADGDKDTPPHTDIVIGATQVDPPDPNAGRNWAMNMFVSFVGLSAGSIILNYLWIRTSGIKRR